MPNLGVDSFSCKKKRKILNCIFGQIRLVKYCLLQVRTVQYFNMLFLGHFTTRISNSLVDVRW